ncbi:MAG: bifunctional phosphopantothenoylcysteine decarboxylase/phosphopantothenate--cysteine ligase CoaBC [Gammaproteobacteria bacterium]|nr:bifunctional phosphopantothenoylcysteine decarboxylase/phosphopantothenate--cysteine ligase CoaBC [Gammaproteobacteria bacterium]
MHRNTRIILGITGGIAAYKSPDLVRRLIERGAEVRVVMSRAAMEFITPLTLQAVSGHPVHQHLLDSDAESGMGHIELARWAEIILIAPATAHFMAKIVHGEADDLLSALVVASEATLAIAPAMNRQMWQNPATRNNLKTLVDRGVSIIGPGEGDQACGEVGVGRMTEPDEIAQQLLGDGIPQLFSGKKILVTAGPTWEAIDPVRGISNRSSGKMGFAIARAARDFGATVTMVRGPVNTTPPSGVECIDVQSARQMRDAVMSHVSGTDIFIGVAAVADYRPALQEDQKIKAKEPEIVLKLIKNPDILAEVAAREDRPFTVGFAAETRDLLANAKKKLRDKKIDVIVANDVSGENGAIDNDTNAASLIHQTGVTQLGRADKYRLAITILEKISVLMNPEPSTA